MSKLYQATKLVYRLAYNGDVVAFKMGRRQGAGAGSIISEGTWVNKDQLDSVRGPSSDTAAKEILILRPNREIE